MKKETEELYFPEFYSSVVEKAIIDLKEEMRDQRLLVTESFYETIQHQLEQQLQTICLRTLIVEMHVYKENGLLRGKTLQKEYSYFCKEVIEKEDFVQKIFGKYPELQRCVKEKLKYLIDYYLEVVEHFCQDRLEISEKMCEGDCRRITGMEAGFSDTHRQGKQVLKIIIDHGKEVLYKPHSLKNEVLFAEMLQWLSQKIQIDQKQYSIVSKQDHGWSAIVQYSTCQSEKEVERYYKRLGIQLCLAYILNTNDLHYENLIAVGEYPVIVDLETLVQIQPENKLGTVSDEVFIRQKDSVLATGILPAYHWRQGGGVDGSAIGGNEGQLLPFRVPKIMHPKTSEMCLSYEYPKMKKAKNQVTLKDKDIMPAKYLKGLLAGFSKAYMAVVNHKQEVLDRLRELGIETVTSRYLIADTQKYHMALLASYHPQLLKNQEKRRQFFRELFNGMDENDDVIIKSEIASLLQGDIPYFDYPLNTRDLFTSQGERKRNYFPRTALEMIEKKIRKLDKVDLSKQLEYIQISIEFMFKEKSVYSNKVYQVSGISEKKKSLDFQKEINWLTNRVIGEAVWNRDETEVNWEQLKFVSEDYSGWKLDVMDMYLYEGLSGMLLLFYRMKQNGTSGSSKIYHTLKQMIFRYTEAGLKNIDRLCSKRTGMYEGESSLVYTYLLLYQQSKEKDYLVYAKKHADIVETLLSMDSCYDLLSGNAGAAWVMILLYRNTQKKKYLNIAKKAIDILLVSAVRQNQGIGWIIKDDIPPMAGMAHGNSGFLLPVLALWKETEESKYEKLAMEIWKYEDSLYDPDINNWSDVRSCGGNKDEIGPVAWCHGVGGIVLSRMFCYQIVENSKWQEIIKKDIQRGYRKLMSYWYRDSWSLCHGICGNLWILELVEETLDSVNTSKRMKLLPPRIKLPLQEKVNPGFMSGYGGVLYYLLTKQIQTYSCANMDNVLKKLE